MKKNFLQLLLLTMKPHTGFPGLLHLAFVLTALSCGRDENENIAKTRKELITAAPWKRTAFISNPAYDWNANGTADVNVLNIMFPCEKDNLDIYKTNGIFDTDEGLTKCNPSDPQIWSVSWRFDDNETRLIFDGTDESTLIELTATTLKFRSTFVEGGGSYTHVETYGH